MKEKKKYYKLHSNMNEGCADTPFPFHRLTKPFRKCVCLYSFCSLCNIFFSVVWREIGGGDRNRLSPFNVISFYSKAFFDIGVAKFPITNRALCGVLNISICVTTAGVASLMYSYLYLEWIMKEKREERKPFWRFIEFQFRLISAIWTHELASAAV